MEIRIIGCGAMGAAIAKRLSKEGKRISLYDKIPEKAKELALTCKAPVVNEPLENLDFGDMLLLAVKPQDFLFLSKELSGFKGKFAVSILTGISSNQLKDVFPHSHVVRMIPNLAVEYGKGVVALADDPSLFDVKEDIEKTFSSLGLVLWIEEKLCNAATAVAGSGPALVYALMLSIVDAATLMGFSNEHAYEIVKQMMQGSLTLLYESNLSPAEWIKKVASPAGTTVEGLKTFEKGNVKEKIVESFLAAFKRAEELGSN